jgi:hypothetical protein
MTNIYFYDTNKNLILKDIIEDKVVGFDTTFAKTRAYEYLRKIGIPTSVKAFEKATILNKFNGSFCIKVYLNDTATIREILLKKILD